MDARANGCTPASITVLQDRDDLPELYACMDINVLPSHREGFPRVLMEGAACGLPQVGTQIRGCRQTIADNETGLLVPVADATALADAMAKLLTDPDLRKRFGEAARKKGESEFDQQEVFKKVAACYKELIAKKLPEQNGRG